MINFPGRQKWLSPVLHADFSFSFAELPRGIFAPYSWKPKYRLVERGWRWRRLEYLRFSEASAAVQTNVIVWTFSIVNCHEHEMETAVSKSYAVSFTFRGDKRWKGSTWRHYQCLEEYLASYFVTFWNKLKGNPEWHLRECSFPFVKSHFWRSRTTTSNLNYRE